MSPLIWLPKSVRELCASEADAHYPNESGGVFMGYHSSRGIVVTATILGGPAAQRTPVSFAPDLSWQNAQIAKHYCASGRLDTYLGDWHTHPDTVRAYLSRHDKNVLRKIITSAEARCDTPAMVIFAGSRGSGGSAVG